MIAGDDPEAVLAVGLVAHCTAAEHAAIGPLVKRHAELYERMKIAPLDELPTLACERYTAVGLVLVEVPAGHVIVGQDELPIDDAGPTKRRRRTR